MPAPLDVITACLPRDLGILRLAVAGLRQHLAVRSISVATDRRHFPAFRAALGPDVALLDEDELIPGMTLTQLREKPLPEFPRGAGWYFQQLLKLAFGLRDPADGDFLIWDADTVPLRPIALHDAEGRAWFTQAAELHPPYFATYERLLGHPAPREFSFIAQHMVVDRAILREMLTAIEAHCAGDGNWAWKIIENLAGTGPNRFSEYETYGHYVKAAHPAVAAYRQLAWTRDGTRLAGRQPTAGDLERLARDYDFVAFEAGQQPLRRAVRWLRSILERSGRRRAKQP